MVFWWMEEEYHGDGGGASDGEVEIETPAPGN